MAEAQFKLNKRNIVYFLGDVAFDEDHMELISGLPGRKILVSGNHDDLVPLSLQAKVFEGIHGMVKYKEFWLTHAPIHPAELRGKVNIHGHVHSASIEDDRYINACPDNIGRFFLSLHEAREIIKSRTQ